MKSLTEIEYFPDSVLEQFRLAERFVESLPEADKNERVLRCHEVARAVCAILPNEHKRVADGRYGYVDHSWIVITVGYRLFILDPYAVASLPQVQLHEVYHVMRDGRAALYIESMEGRRDVRDDVVQYLINVGEVV